MPATSDLVRRPGQARSPSGHREQTLPRCCGGRWKRPRVRTPRWRQRPKRRSPASQEKRPAARDRHQPSPLRICPRWKPSTRCDQGDAPPGGVGRPRELSGERAGCWDHSETSLPSSPCWPRSPRALARRRPRTRRLPTGDAVRGYVHPQRWRGRPVPVNPLNCSRTPLHDAGSRPAAPNADRRASRFKAGTARNARERPGSHRGGVSVRRPGHGDRVGAARPGRPK